MQQLFEFAGNHPLLIAAAFGLIAMIVVTEVRLRNRGFREVTPADAVKLINDSNAAVVDVRSQEAFAKGHIIGAQHAPQAEIDRLAEGRLKKLRKRPVIVCCDSGINSGRAAATLRGLGFDQVYTLRGGIEGWKRENYPLTT